MKYYISSAMIFSFLITIVSAQQITVDGTPGQLGLLIDNSNGGNGIFVDSSADNGITLLNPANFGLQINNAGLHGINVSDPMFNGLLVANAGLDGIAVSNPQGNGLVINNSVNDGIRILNSQNSGVFIQSASTGLVIDGPTGTGVIISDALDNGITIFTPAQLGLQINNAGLHGINISDPTFIGVLSSNAGTDGMLINNSGEDGLEITGSGADGIRVLNAGSHAGYFSNANTSSASALYIKSGNDSNMDLEISGHARITSKGGYYFHLDDNNNSSDPFDIINSIDESVFTIFESGNATIKNQLKIENSTGDAIQISSPGNDAIDVSAGHNGIHVHDVTNRAGYFHNAPTSNVATVFITHGDDSKTDLGFGGHARITSNGDLDLTLDANNNDDNILIVRQSDGTPILLVYESPMECVSRGKLSAWGDINGLSDANIVGMLSKGSGSFKIDHPLDPTNKYLYHSFVESPDMMNVYNGNVLTNENGIATVTLPDYFCSLNRDFRYQLTTIGSFSPVMIKEEITDNKFVIASRDAHVKISWQVTGIRQDPFANQNRIQVEVEKDDEHKGTYLHPEAWGHKNLKTPQESASLSVQ